MVSNPDDDLEVFVDDMRDMSDFVYRFANMRNVVRKNEGKKVYKYGWFGEETTTKFFEPALIITTSGAQEEDADQNLKYDITPAAVLRFLENNRKMFKEPTAGAYLEFDKDQIDSEPFSVEDTIKDLGRDNMKIVDYDDKFSTEDGGLVYAVIVNLTKRWVGVVFRGTIGLTDANTDRDFRLDEKSFFESEAFINVPGGKPATHKGFTEYLFSNREKDSVQRTYVDRILACVDDEFATNPDVAGKGFKLFVSGHSLGGGLSNLFSFRVAQLKSQGHESVKHLPTTVKCMSFAAPCVGNYDFNKEYQFLEQKGFLRHIRVSNEGDVVPTNNIPAPFSFALMGSAYDYTQNGVNVFLRSKEDMVIGYRNTKDMWSQTGLDSVSMHGLPEYEKRLAFPANKEVFKQTIEELYQEAKDFTA